MLITIIVLLLSLTLITFVHELGHLLFAKKYNLYCPEFAIGMGPKLFSVQKGETLYSVRILPIGGFVRIAGEEDDGSEVEEGRRLFDASKLQQAMVLFAGALFNFILGIILIVVANFIIGVPENSNEIGMVSENGIANQLNIKPGDKIYSINDNVVKTQNQTIEQLDLAKKTGNVKIVVESNGQKDEYVFEDVTSEFKLGIRFSSSRNFIAVIQESFIQFISIFTLIGKVLVGLFVDFTSTSSNVSGPVGVYSVLKDFISYGFASILLFVATISINIGVFNLLPIPGLDGSKIVIAIGEHITKRDLPRNIYTFVSVIGILSLLALMILVTIRDISNL